MKQGWEIKKLGEVCAFCSGYTPKESELLECGAVPYFKVSDMNHCDNLKYLTHTSLFLEDGCKVYPKHTIVFPKNGAAIATNKKRILAQDSVVDLNTGGVVANDALVYFEYLYLYFLNLDFRLHTRRGAVPTLDIAELKNKSIPVPPMEEQERIVEELDCLSGMIEKKREQLRELDALVQSIFYQMFGDPITNEKGLEVKKVIDVVKMQRGFDLPVQDRDNEGTIPIYGSNGIIGYHTIHKANFGIITGRSGTLGEVYSSNEPFWPLNTTLFSVDTHGNNVIFLKYIMANFHLERFKAGAGVPTLNRNEFHNEPIPNIPLTLQQEFADKIEAIEKQKELIKQSITQTEELFNARMDYYFN